MNFLDQGFQKLQRYKQTDRQTRPNAIPFADNKNNVITHSNMLL